MVNHLVFNLAALFALVPASLLPYRRPAAGRDLIFWAVLGAAVAGSLAYSLIQLGGPWKTGLAMALWLSITTSLAIFVLLAGLVREAWRLTPLLLPYLLVLALIATFWGHVPEQGHLATVPDTWLILHIVVSLITYGLATVAAVAGLAVFLQERTLKRKQTGALSQMLPSIADGEALELRLLAAAEVVLGLGIVTGMTLQYFLSGRLLSLDHKTLLSLLAFAVIGLLLGLHHGSGLRGRRAARLVLFAYLLLTLAYPGVKFVTDVLIG
jgi:ABC-type uncharacterized transport system permease subunit